MRARWNSILVCIAIAACGAIAQETPSTTQTTTPSTVVTPGGKGGHIPEFWGPSTIGNSVITENAKRIGIGITNLTAFDPLIVTSISGDGGGIGMLG
jgi:hypothetical protein